MYHIIFDIDGTLVESTDFDDTLYVQAVTEVLGDVHIHDDWNRYVHVTDAGILNQICEENNVSTPGTVDLVRSTFGQLVRGYLTETPCIPTKGAIEAIRSLNQNPAYAYGIATGGWGHTAEMKLRSAGIDIEDIPVFSSDHHHERTMIMQACCNDVSDKHDGVVYVGDGPWDITASEQLGWGFIGVGDRLKGLTDIWISDFEDPNWKDAPDRALQLRP